MYKDILFFTNYLKGLGPFDNFQYTLNLIDVLRFFKYANGWFILILRLSQLLDRFRLGFILRLSLNIFFSCDISKGIKIGPAYFPHPFGIVIGADVVINGPVVIFNDINIGKSHPGMPEKMAIIGSNVIISCGVRILGPISIGDNVVISANSVVTSSINNNTTYISNIKSKPGTYFLKLNG